MTENASCGYTIPVWLIEEWKGSMDCQGIFVPVIVALITPLSQEDLVIDNSFQTL